MDRSKSSNLARFPHVATPSGYLRQMIYSWGPHASANPDTRREATRSTEWSTASENKISNLLQNLGRRSSILTDQSCADSIAKQKKKMWRCSIFQWWPDDIFRPTLTTSLPPAQSVRLHESVKNLNGQKWSSVFASHVNFQILFLETVCLSELNKKLSFSYR